MLNIKNFEEKITTLYYEGKTAKEISTILKLKYHQPIYNFFKKKGWDRKGKTGCRKYSVNENFFTKINTEEKAYILGFVCADGHVTTDRLCITVAKKDSDILYKIKKVLNSNHPIKEVERQNPYSQSTNKVLSLATLMIGSVELVKPLIAMGLTSNKTYTLDGNIMKYIPRYLTRDFLRGYFDGDGNISFGKKYSSGYKYNVNICGNEDFLMRSFQTYFPTTNKLYKDLYSRQCYVWKISKREKIIEFMKYLYENSSIFLVENIMNIEK